MTSSARTHSQKPALIATDVDGTLLDEDENVSSRNRAAARGKSVV